MRLARLRVRDLLVRFHLSVRRLVVAVASLGVTVACGGNHAGASSTASGSSSTGASGSASSGSSATATSASSSSSSSGSSATSSSSSSSTSSTSSSGSSGSSGAFFDPGQVYFVGTLDPAFCGSDVLVHPDQPRAGLVGFPCFDVDFVLRGDGGLVYLYTDADANSHVVEFVPDGFTALLDGGWSYPSAPEANDPVVPTPQCDALGGPNGFLLDPGTGEVVFNCPGSTDSIDASGSTRVAAANPLALGPGHRALVFADDGGLAVLDSSGSAVGVAGLPAAAGTEVNGARSLADGWWVAFDEPGARELWHVPFAGAATAVGNYPTFTASLGEGALDSAGALYLFGVDPTDPTQASFTIARLDLGGTQAVTLYTDYLAPPDDLQTTPPQTFAQVGPRGGRLFSFR